MSSIERARVLFEHYGVPVEDMADMMPSLNERGSISRVRTRIRMRVRLSCHICGTTLRRGQECRNCSHTLRNDCPPQLMLRRARSVCCNTVI
jgi:hypothetical protein